MLYFGTLYGTGIIADYVRSGASDGQRLFIGDMYAGLAMARFSRPMRLWRRQGPDNHIPCANPNMPLVPC